MRLEVLLVKVFKNEGVFVMVWDVKVVGGLVV